ncbi:MAG: FYDLN acid domain-containing protein [Acidobacteriota bacterium]
MPDLGKKFECYNCRTKFYNLGKPEAICPKCGANQKDARSDETPAPAPRPPRRSSVLMEPIPEESASEFGEEGPEEETAADDEDLDETEELGQVEPVATEEEEEF